MYKIHDYYCIRMDEFSLMKKHVLLTANTWDLKGPLLIYNYCKCLLKVIKKC